MLGFIRAAAVAGAATLSIALAGCNRSCEEGGKVYEDGESWECSDGCNSCSCEDGTVTSTAVACIVDAGLPD